MKRNILIFTLLTVTILFFTGCQNAKGSSDKVTTSQNLAESNQSITLEKTSTIQKYTPPVSYYEMNGEASFSISDEYKTDKLSYGDNTLGSFYIVGGEDSLSKNNGYSVYSSSNDIKLTYNYENTYHTKNEDNWNLVKSGEDKVAGVTLKNDVDYGAIIVQCSSNGNDNWKTLSKKTNTFDNKTDRTKLLEFYTISEQNAREEKYYRIIVCYEMKRRTKEHWYGDTFKTIRCVELYQFYLSYSSNPVSLLDIYSGADVSNSKSVKDGFIIDKGGSEFSVSLRKGSQQPYEVQDRTTVCDPGEYTVLINSKTNNSYQYNITITGGLDVCSVNPLLYEGGKKGEYKEKGTVTENSSFGDTSLTKIKLCQNYGKRIKNKKVGDVDKYGFVSDSVGILLSLNKPSNSNYKFYADDYGKKDKQKVNGVYVGTVNTGALIIQKSPNGSDWETIDQGAYTNGIYTTNYANYYADKGDILVYTPDGQELINGLYLKITFAYNLENTKTEDRTRCIEVYNMYLCSNNLDAITFNNLSAEETIRKMIGDDEEVDAAIYKNTETLLTGSETVTGFKINTSLNPTVKYTVKRNGQEIDSSGDTFQSPGKYEITLKSVFDDKREVTIFVDNQTSEQALKTYFKNGFLDGKRIFSEGQYPVYEGGLTKYQISELDSKYPSLSGTIKNKTTGNEITVNSSYSERSGVIKEAGHYIAELSTRPKDKASDFPGDYRIFTFEFEVIQEGTAPGPVYNQNKLNDYSITNISDSYPMYYGLTYPSASKGKITLAFSSKEAAKEYAYNYEKGTVEEQSDGTFTYNGSFIPAKKDKYNDTWGLTQATNYFAEQLVQTGYFDLSDQSNYITLSEDDLQKNNNLRALELDRSITIFADGEKEKLCSNDVLPILSPKPYSYLSLEEKDKVESGYYDFKFVKDKYECDSSHVVITDINGTEYNIEYGKGVGKQLQDYNCPSGKVTIHEKNIYDDETSYEAVFIAEGDNTASITIMCYQDGKQIKKTLNHDNADENIEVQAFEIEELTDDLDPFSLVSVSANTDNGTNWQKYYVADQDSLGSFTDNGKYEIKVVNRLGYAFSFYVNVSGSTYATLSFTGENADDTPSIFTSYGTKNVELPKLIKYGYELVGFSDDDNILYSNKIDEIQFCGTKVLEAEWKAKEFQLTLLDDNGKEIDKKTIKFGEKTELNEPQKDDGKEFDYWSCDGEKIKDLSFTLDKEADITLVANYKKQILPTNDIDNKPDEVDKTDKRSAKPFFIIILISSLSFGCIVLTKRYKNKAKDDDEEN